MAFLLADMDNKNAFSLTKMAGVYITGLVAGAVYLYRQMAEIQRIFEMT